MSNEHSVSMTFKSDNIMPWSSTLEEDCKKLASDREAGDDEMLVAMARISRICMQATEVFRLLNDGPENGGHSALHISSLKKSLDECRALLSDRQEQHCELSASDFFISFMQQGPVPQHCPIALAVLRISVAYDPELTAQNPISTAT
jgi:hypothetical protein